MADAPSLSDVPGWLGGADELLFDWILTWQSHVGVRADLLELGVYQGRSAIHIGRFVTDGERFVVCDLFEDTQNSNAVPGYVKSSYSMLTQSGFEANYLKFHAALPTIVRGLTSSIADHVAAGSCRFVHIDASHLYTDVRADIASARNVLRPDGIVVFDDYRNEKTVGTAAAVWEAVAVDDLVPICVTDAKLYATWGDPRPLQDEIIARLKRHRAYHGAPVAVRGREVIRVEPTSLPAAAFRGPGHGTSAPNSATARLMWSAGRAASSLGYRLSRLAVADAPLAAAKRAAGRRLGRMHRSR